LKRSVHIIGNLMRIQTYECRVYASFWHFIVFSNLLFNCPEKQFGTRLIVPYYFEPPPLIVLMTIFCSFTDRLYSAYFFFFFLQCSIMRYNINNIIHAIASVCKHRQIPTEGYQVINTTIECTIGSDDKLNLPCIHF